MSLFEDYPHGISTIDVDYVRPKLASSHLIVENQHAVFIDVGTSLSADNLLHTLKEKNIPVEQVDYIIVTHVHLDHAGGAGRMMALCPNAKLVAHPRGARHMIDPSKLVAGTIAVYGEAETLKLYGEIPSIDAERVIEAPDGFTIDWHGRELQFIDTPGHAKHHFCIWDARSRSFFTGDTFGLAYRELYSDKGAFVFPTTTPVQFEPDALANSIDRLLSFGPEQMFLTHYGRIDDLAPKGAQLKAMVQNYVDIAQQAAQQHPAGDARHTAIVDGLLALLMDKMAAHGCAGDAESQREVIGMDMELNAQGLEVWLARQEKQT